jgi:choline kinase
MLPVVIVAGGVASRLRPYSEERPKSLMELEPGLTIAEFILERFRRAGLSPVYLVTRKEFVEAFRSKLGPSVVVLTVDLEEFGNLYSVYTALKHVKPPFLVAMSDHVFEYEILKRILSHRSSRAFTICLDREPSRAEAQEGLKVKLVRGVVVAVGKSLESRYGIDTGLILVREKAYAYVERVISEKGPTASIGDALDLAAKEGEVDYVDVTGLLWKDVDTAEDLAKARALFKRILIRDYGKRCSGPLTLALIRPATLRLAALEPPSARARAALLAASLLLALGALTLSAAPPPQPILAFALLYAVAFLGDLADLAAVLARRGESLVRVVALAELVAEVGVLSLIVNTLGERVPHTLTALAAASSAVPIFLGRGGGRPGRLAWVADPLLKYAATAAIAFAGFEPAALAYWVCSNLAAAWPGEVLAAPPKPAGEAFPKLGAEVKRAERKLRAAAASGFKLALALLVLSYAQSYLGDVILLNLEWLELKVGDVVPLLALVLTVYYGYRVLIGAKILVDALAVKVVRALGVTESVARHIGLDVLYLLAAWLALAFVPKALQPVPVFGSILSRAAALTLLAVVVVLLYDFVKVVYTTFEDAFKRALKSVAEAVGEGEA